MACSHRGCKRKVHGHGMCVTHYRQWYRKKHPLKAAYQNLRANARRRGKAFTITFADFCRFAIKCRLLLYKGRAMDSYTIDRIDNSKGYELGNLQVLTKKSNIEKYQSDKKLNYDWKQKFGRYYKSPDPLTENDAPF